MRLTSPQIYPALMMRKGDRTPALHGVVFCPALMDILSVRLKGRHRRGCAPMFIKAAASMQVLCAHVRHEAGLPTQLDVAWVI